MTNLYQFVPYDKSLECDHAVVRHELGHALISYYFGWQIGRVAFIRVPEGMLGGGARIRARSVDISNHEYMKESVIRLLAGEIAARKFLELPLLQVCEPEKGVQALSPRVVRRIFGHRQEDLFKALCFTDDLHNTDSFGEFWMYYDQAIEIVENGWLGIQAAARYIEKQGLPTAANKELLIPALDLIREFERHGVASKQTKAIEVVHRQLRGSLFTRLDRFVRVKFKKTLEITYDSASTPGLLLPSS